MSDDPKNRPQNAVGEGGVQRTRRNVVTKKREEVSKQAESR